MQLKVKLVVSNLLSFFLLNIVHAQHKHIVSGIVKEKISGEPMLGADVYLLEVPQYKTISNGYGFFSLSAPAGNYTLIISYTGYRSDSLKINLNDNVQQDILLEQQSDSLANVVIKTTTASRNTGGQIGVQKLDVSQIKDIPVIFGEKDVLKTVQLLPGIKSAGEGNSGFFVRGGGADENLILLDGAPVYNASHLLGFFSSFNSDAIKDLTLYKGALPAQYGGRLSSVVDVTTNDGNNQEFHANGGIGLISSRLTLEGPLKKNKGSFVISGRRTYADLLLKLSNDSSINRNTLYFYDINAKGEYTFDDKNKIYISGYFGKDKLFLSDRFGIDYGNTTGSFRWNHVFGYNLFSNTSLIYTDYNYTVQLESGSTGNLLLKSRIRDFSFKEDFQYSAGDNSKIYFGASSTLHIFNPGVVDASPGSSYNSVKLQNKYALENNAYAAHDISLTKKLGINYGLRLSAFSILGPGNFYTYNAAGNPVDTAAYTKGQIVKTYWDIEPRLSVSWKFSESSKLEASYTRTTQNLHLISNSVTAYPTDLWIPSSPNVKPEKADQVSLGYFKNIRHDYYEFSSEIYYKRLQNQIDYKNGAVLDVNENIESQLLFGAGRAYGWELFFKKKVGRLTGWASYTLSRTERKIAGINNGNWYPARQDQTHNVALVGIFKLNPKWTFSANWVYNTGNAVTFPDGKYVVNGTTAFYYTERNGYRMPAYHRLDVSATLMNKKKKRWQGSWTFSLYNVYGRENPYSIQFESNPVNPLETTAKEIYLFRWVPSVTYNFLF